LKSPNANIGLARAGREMAANLVAISNDFMAKAVDIDTTRQKKSPAT